jgi:hypothetical protein
MISNLNVYLLYSTLELAIESKKGGILQSLFVSQF